MSDTTPELGGSVDADAKPSGTPMWLAATLAIIFGIFFAYDAWEAVGNLVGMSNFAGSLDASIAGGGWVILVLAIALPIILFAIAFSLGHRRSPLVQIGFYVAGLAVSAATSLDIIAGFARWFPIG